MGELKKYHGIVVEDRALNSREIKVYVRDLLPFSAGALEDSSKVETYSVNHPDGTALSGNVTTTNNIIAEYFGGSSNRSTLPDVVKGEQVNVYQYQDEDKYYWKEMGRDDNLRSKELVRLSAANKSSPNTDSLTEDNSYYAEIDTKVAQRIRICTSKSNGEPFKYTIVADAKNGFVQVADDQGNRFEIQSAAKTVTMVNREGGSVSIVDKNVMINAPDNIIMKAGKNVIINSPIIALNGETFTNNINTIPNGSSLGNMTIAGNIQSAGNINTTADINAAGVVTGSNIH